MNTVGLIISVIISALLLLTAVLLCIKIRLIFVFSKPQNGKFDYSAVISLFGNRITKNIGSKTKPRTKGKSEQKAPDKTEYDKNLKDKIIGYYNTFLKIKYTWFKSKDKIRKNISVNKLSVNIKFGLDDAAQTGIATGTLWASVYNVVAFISNFASLTEPQISITPVFDDECVEFDGECIIVFRIANIISILITAAINYYIIQRKFIYNKK